MYQQIRTAVEEDFLEVDQYIIEQLHSTVPLVENIGHYIVEAGGKRLRPILVLLAARCCNIQNQQHIPLAAVIEFIHTATLLHDDVVDMSNLRRGRPTVNAEWNNPSSVLVGDFIYSRAFQILVKLNDLSIMKVMADTTNTIAEGEVLQLISKNNPQPSEENYMRVIHNKTAILFQAAAQCGAKIAQAPVETETALKNYGMHLGIAFQLIDDVMDYAGDADAMGKNIGDDLAEGKPTLPLIYTLEQGTKEQAELIRRCLVQATINQEDSEEIIELVRHSGALDYTREKAQQQSQLAMGALEQLPDSKYLDTLKTLVEFSTARSS